MNPRIIHERNPEKLRILNTTLTGILLCMQDEHDDVWRWSVAFTEVLERLIGEPRSDPAARTDWPDHRDRLGWWRRDIEEARDLYLQARPERLRRLYDYWRIIAPDDTAEQVRYARETYRQFRFWASA